MKIKNLFSGLCISMLLGFSATVSAELLIDPVGKSEVGKGEIGAFFGKSSVEFEGPLALTGDVNRTYLSAYYAYGLSDKIDIVGFGAYIFDAEAETYGEKSSGGNGFLFGGGARGPLNLAESADVDFEWYAQFLMANEDYGDDADGDGKELSGGVIAVKELANGIIGFAGVEYVLYSDGTLSISSSEKECVSDYYDDYSDEYVCTKYESTGSVDIERKNKLGIRIGARIPWDKFDIVLGAALMNESSFSIGVNMPFGGTGGGS